MRAFRISRIAAGAGLAAALFLGACASSGGAAGAAAAAADGDDTLYLNIVWHQHQPLYYKDADGVYSRPWVRVHATKDYWDMAAQLLKWPKLNVTFNLTPVLLKQLDDLAAGAKDRYRVLAEKPAAALAPEDRDFILARFFDANSKIVKRFPRYAELLAKKTAGAAFAEDDWRDLQVWFNLAWFDPELQTLSPLKELVAKGRGFSEADKAVLFGEVDRVVKAVVPVHKQLRDTGRVEIITTPYAHPILPLIYNSDLGKKADPTAVAPPRFSYPNDAIAQLKKSVEIYREKFGAAPVGLWPGEGAVAHDIVPLVGKAGYTWMATGEPVLAKSLGIGSFSRDGKDTVIEADALYRPYYVENGGQKVAVVFRDLRLSDLVGFEYSGMSGQAAADDFMARLERIRAELKASGATGPHLVSVILDGENAWENYDLDGKAFFDAFYGALSASKTIKTITPGQYLAKFPEQRSLDRLADGAWFSQDFATWYGEDEEAVAWDYLGQVRAHLAKYDIEKRRTTTPDKLAAALDAMYLAEGSDWFWWYGDDQDSGVDEYFDNGFRELLKNVYRALGDPVPAFLDAPIIPKRAVAADAGFKAGAAFAPTVDGVAAPGEWDAAARVSRAGGVQASSVELVSSLSWGFAKDGLRIKIELRQAQLAAGTKYEVYLGRKQVRAAAFTRAGTALGHSVERVFAVGTDSASIEAAVWKDGAWAAVPGGAAQAAAGGGTAEFSLPFDVLGELSPADTLNLRAVVAMPSGDSLCFPPEGPAAAVVPEQGTAEPLFSVDDPAGDDHGPGGYTYPTDAVFKPGVFDIVRFEAATTPASLVFTLTFAGPIENPWSSGVNLSVQTVDIYIDQDGQAGSGARLLLEGRNAQLAGGLGWEKALWIEGWNRKIFGADAAGRPKELPGEPRVVVDAANRKLTVTVARDALGAGDPADWGYAAVVLSQDGYPAAGVRRVRDVQAGAAAQWRGGGAPDDKNHTRIFDLALGAGAAETQEAALGRYGASAEDPATLGPDQFGSVPLARVRR
jgi:alpha-amylase/alpha-mannosidase (GH57 family)